MKINTCVAKLIVIDKISLQHTTPAKFQSEIEKQIPELAGM
jgi:hypothetical protein